MANFSGGGSYLLLGYILIALCSFPATLLIWTGLAVPLKKINGALDYAVVKRRLKRILLPICLALSIPVFMMLKEAEDPVTWWEHFLVFIVSLVPTIGVYFSISFSAKRLNKKEKLTKGNWLLQTLGYAILAIIIGFFIALAILLLYDF